MCPQASFYYTTDALGSTILLTDSAQAAAATPTSTTGTQAATNPWTYAGGYNDTTSNRIKFGARYYNPARGRFTQPDPSAQETNRYAYVSCNPINATDPSGLGYLCDQDLYLYRVYQVVRVLLYFLYAYTGNADFFFAAIFASGVALSYYLDSLYWCAIGL